MNLNDVLEHVVGFIRDNHTNDASCVDVIEALKGYIVAALLAERERCAKIADDTDIDDGDPAYASGYLAACAEIAFTIRKGDAE